LTAAPVTPYGPPTAALWAVRAAHVIIGDGRIVERGVVVGRDDRIVEVRGDGAPIPHGATVLYEGPGVVLPGLIDAHVHLGGIQDPAEPSPILAMLRASPELFAMWVARDARVTLEAGFTTVRDCGGRFVRAVCAVREAIRLGLQPGPRIVVGGWLSQTGGHFDRQMTGLIGAAPDGIADGPEEVRKRIRERLREGADFIKVCASNSPIADGQLPAHEEYSPDELRAAVQEAHAHRRSVAAHAESETAIAACVDAGVDTVEHGTYLTAAVADRMAARGTVLVPTLGVFPALVERLPRWLMALPVEEARTVLDRHLASFRLARARGVPIAMGSDTWRCLPHGDNSAELELFVRHGMSPMEAIQAATSVAAGALSLGETVGTLQGGKIADLLVVGANPLDDITVLRDKNQILRVIRDGRTLVSPAG
jgi:imidazolonepropionase-like amidohydrolase